MHTCGRAPRPRASRSAGEHLPSLPKQTPRVELASPSETSSPDPRHLHNQQFQPLRADSSGGKGGCACWGASCPGPRLLPSGPPGSPKGCGLTRVIVRSSRSCRLPHPHPSAHCGPTAGRTLCKHRTRAPAEGPAGRRAAFRGPMPALPRFPPRRLPQKEQPPKVSRHNPGTTPVPTPGWRAPLASQRWPRRGRAGTTWVGGRAGPGGRVKLARATPKSGEKSWKRGHGGWGGVTSKRRHGWRRRRSRLMTEARREDSG